MPSDLPAPRPPPARVGGGPFWNAPWFDSLQFLVFAGALVAFAVSGAAGMGYHWQWYRVPDYFFRVGDGGWESGPLLQGLRVTLLITGWSILLTLAIGLASALARLSDSFSGRFLAKLHLETVRNTPLLIQIYLFYFVLGPIVGLDRFWVGVVALAVFEGAFAGEVIRAGIQSVPRGQREAGLGLGLGTVGLHRHVILPQAVPLMLPPLTGVVISLIRNSAIVSVIAVFDLTTEARNIIAETFLSFEIWLTVAAMYLVFTCTLSILANRLERRVRAPG